MKLVVSALIATALTACQGDETLRSYGAADKVWVLAELNGSAFTASATLTFPNATGIAGTAPCNSYSATMTAPYPWFEVGPILATKRACRDLTAESAYFAALERATLSEVLEDTLILSNPDGLEMVFKASD